ncbi:MAG: pyruvate:ferredoxin (flavodoxin) oxidoreductase [Candidatus Jettenia sp.]|uniref:Pyruvate ferredoxin/flavodoxin oxidoreductase n=1 Tax=Candidatus Jettenia caeni TaxID=247490 RepID=I3IKM6_9BACT|nr:pyruvate:ferredoxin (flavodoxin) oxidoreductase [Candidatus Jettenia sp. AMX1]MBC6929435.1 pyruvate:ferredoxin (flavodoxin) oxidoreductase [Candidatus Jettenia sp.]WKZ14124.1 MAG: pyruvate:ferredoxin (flavodoxin) oxidoreductase [Candidatus Jettenia caeni]MCE7880836.1 pyruvate:ferredoxin (flavodoxin) oxidoreductase [Candidatus Jettenia sp. AMX1]MCQ3927620.1 pyruvate:ferredoxin (flavodoxin) oxidoreductase [Candidatus Jettenia sp.]MDL1939305.1 pyruvate:ferredoxin (flavodoxin) oxidoreductase [C
MDRKTITVDGCTACAHVVHAVNEIITIYPITPSSPIAEICDAKTADGQVNIWGMVPKVCQMQSESGVAGAVHGSLTTGALATTISASQGLLLIIPNMYKIAGELTSTVFHVTARSLACQGLSIFGDHSDVMAARSTGFAMLCSQNVQEAMDFALIAQAATLESRVPFLHFFDGFRTSHEVRKIEEVSFDDMRAMIDNDLVIAHRMRGLTSDRPNIRGTAQNPDVYFQGRETVNKYYNAAPGIIQKAMDKFAGIAGRRYKLFDYFGDPDAERVIVTMGSSGETVLHTIHALNAQGGKLGLVQVRLFRPFDIDAFVGSLPKNVRAIAVLDRTKEPGAIGEPLYLDVRTAIGEAMEKGLVTFGNYPTVVGGRYGLGSKDFTPAMVKAIVDNISQKRPKNHFTIGIHDDVTGTSLEYDESFSIEGSGVFRALFYGLGSDGTVSANKNTIKIIGTETDNYAQGYFLYDSKKSGAMTVSHLRFGKDEIGHPYLLPKANFIACHNPVFLEKIDMLSHADTGATFLLTTSRNKDEIWDTLPVEVQEQLISRRMKFSIIDASAIAEELGLGAKINMIMQTAFFVISGVIPKEDAIQSIKSEIKKTYAKKGEEVVKLNYAAVDKAIQSIAEVVVPDKVTSKVRMRAIVPEDAPDFVKRVTARMIANKGDSLPVSAMPDDGTWPTGTTQYEKRSIGTEIPVWEPDICIQCGQCSFVCPHATIRIKAYDPSLLQNAPSTFQSIDATGKELKGLKFTVQVAPEDCTGCGSCVFTCPAYKKDAEGKKIPDFKAINMRLQEPRRRVEAENYKFFLSLPELDPAKYKVTTVKGSQFSKPLFEYHSACAGCGETPYIKLLTQLFGDRLVIANSTGCSSIYGGNLPTTPYTKRDDGRGPAWSNSLFEDNAEFGLGMRQTADKFCMQAREFIDRLATNPSYADAKGLFDSIKNADQSTQEGIEAQRARVEELKKRVSKDSSIEAKHLHSLADYLVRKSVWAIGGDGWAYDIGYGGLDHVLASGENIKILILDTEVYSNTGGQMSKSTPLAAMAQFAAGGKRTPKKNIGMIMATYGNIYIAQVAFGANQIQTVKAISEAEAYHGPALIIAYSTCIAHGIEMSKGVEAMKKAVACGHWPLYRYNPVLEKEGKNPLVIDSEEPTISFEEYAYNENRYRSLRASNPELAAALMKEAGADVKRRWILLKHMAAWSPGNA